MNIVIGVLSGRFDLGAPWRPSFRSGGNWQEYALGARADLPNSILTIIRRPRLAIVVNATSLQSGPIPLLSDSEERAFNLMGQSDNQCLDTLVMKSVRPKTRLGSVLLRCF